MKRKKRNGGYRKCNLLQSRVPGDFQRWQSRERTGGSIVGKKGGCPEIYRHKPGLNPTWEAPGHSLSFSGPLSYKLERWTRSSVSNWGAHEKYRLLGSVPPPESHTV